VEQASCLLPKNSVKLRIISGGTGILPVAKKIDRLFAIKIENNSIHSQISLQIP